MSTKKVFYESMGQVVYHFKGLYSQSLLFKLFTLEPVTNFIFFLLRGYSYMIKMFKFTIEKTQQSVDAQF